MCPVLTLTLRPPHRNLWWHGTCLDNLGWSFPSQYPQFNHTGKTPLPWKAACSQVLGYRPLCGGRGGIILSTTTSILEKGRKNNFGISSVFHSEGGNVPKDWFSFQCLRCRCVATSIKSGSFVCMGWGLFKGRREEPFRDGQWEIGVMS